MTLSRLALLGRTAALLGCASTLATLAACDRNKAPTGQVVATINGDEVTRRDVAAELSASGAQQLTDVKAVQPLVVDKIINRKLLVQQAQKDGIDKSPEFLAKEQRAREVLLASMEAERWGSQVNNPTDVEVQNYIGSHPWMFGQRRILLVDQIRTSAKGIDPKALGPLSSNDQVAAYLTQQKHPFQRGRTTLDTLALPEETASKVLALSPNMPFVVSQNGVLVVNAIVGGRDAPVPADKQAELASAVMKRTAGEKAVEGQLKSMRATAKITYQPGFAPPQNQPAP